MIACVIIQIHLEIGPRRVTEAIAGTREQGRELALAYMWRTHIETGSRRPGVAEAIAGTAQIRCGRWLTPASRWGPASSLHTSCVCVLLCFINPILGNRYGPGVSSCQQISDYNLKWPSNVTTSLAIPVPSLSFFFPFSPYRSRANRLILTSDFSY